MIESIKRNGTEVILNIKIAAGGIFYNTGFKFDTGSALFAELLISELYSLRQKANEEIAGNCTKYLEGIEISKLKSKLIREWNGAKHCWK